MLTSRSASSSPRPIAAFQNTQFELAEMKARVEAAKYLVCCRSEEAAGYGQRKVRYSVEAAQAKLMQPALPAT